MNVIDLINAAHEASVEYEARLMAIAKACDGEVKELAERVIKHSVVFDRAAFLEAYKEQVRPRGPMVKLEWDQGLSSITRDPVMAEALRRSATQVMLLMFGCRRAYRITDGLSVEKNFRGSRGLWRISEEGLEFLRALPIGDVKPAVAQPKGGTAT